MSPCMWTYLETWTCKSYEWAYGNSLRYSEYECERHLRVD